MQFSSSTLRCQRKEVRIPNWCECLLKVTGPAEEIIKFRGAAKGRGPNPAPNDEEDPLSLHALVPQPAEFKEKGSDWYNWRLANWGTKWDVDSRIVQEDKELVEYGFDSAWSPPMEWLAKVGPKFPDLSFRLWYAEGGCYFAGVYTVEGDNASNEEKDYVEAQIEENGSYQVTCEHCDNEIEITSKNEGRICDDCVQFRCVRCGKHEDVHVDGKCPFDSTTFKNSSEKIK